MSGKIVITRALEQGESFASVIMSKLDGVNEGDFLFEPLLEIEKDEDLVLPYLGHYSCIIVTSVHGCDLIPVKSEEFTPQFYCVGTATAGALIAKGYQPGIVMQTAKDLVDAVSARHAGSRERILYIKGRDVSVDMKASLSLVGHKVEECEVYRANLLKHFSKDFLLALKGRKIEIITFFSRRTARHFATMVDEMGISNAMTGIKVLCISNAVVGCFHSTFVGDFVVADSPDMSGMVKAIENILVTNR